MRNLEVGVPLVHVTMRLFAVLRDTLGASTIDLDVPEGTSAAEAFEGIPELAQWHGRIAFARKDEMILHDTPLAEGDVLDCLPPVSGG